jgi:photosystem II stability/assembly factor-like uncharacterized protein
MKRSSFFFVLLAGLLFSFSLPAQQLDMSKLKGLHFRNIGPAGMSGRVTAVDVNLKDPKIIFAGTASGGLWRSKDGGTTWQPVFDKEAVLSIGAVTIDPGNPDIIWAGTGEGNPRNSMNMGGGLYRSLDGGDTWQLMGLEKTRSIHRIIVNPRNSDIVYVGAIGSPWGPHPERGVFRTLDGGKTWEKVLYVNEETGVADMVMDPYNPRKLFVAMWQHRRWPWFFKSGGPGSGLYVTRDGGDTWKKLGADDGLPKGELGRIGLAIARNKPDVVYAYVESKKNGLYRSDDGGKHWQLRGTKNIGDRPFYYADIYVDPSNENRVYSLFSRVNVSEDGGKTFKQLIGWKVHPDHHAWWISPDNPDFMIDGNDGGMAITRDRGKTWRFVENLPVGQFYHIRVDNEMPYHVYGGLQDNGSWRGPAYVWRDGGIINTYWEDLYGGDGFDVLPDPSDPRYCYAMSQQGYVGRIDLQTGYTRRIRPVHPEGKTLRFNWNAAIAADPFDKNTIYFGSQYLFRSPDHGNTWEIISPDLTTNDTSRLKQLQSGGLTYDVTGAENFESIITIAPSPLEKGVIWVGTDDGNLQLTRDGGKTWTNLAGRLKGVPAGSWIPQITASTYHAGEAFVVINNYRRNDFTPYLYHTTNYGKSWERMVDGEDVSNYVLSFVQDPVEPKLMFLGTENGLYVSLDAGGTWTHWTEGYPAGVSTMDMVIQPREGDLVIGTFGRAVWILDDLRPLRELAREGTALLDRPLKVFDPPEAWIVSTKSSPGYFSAGDTYFMGKNRPGGAMITYAVKEGNPEKMSAGDKKKAKKVKAMVINSRGDTVRVLTDTPRKGVNRMYWWLDRKGYRFPGAPRRSKMAAQRGGGGYVLPGEYKLVFEYEKQKDSTTISVKADPRLDVDPQVILANRKLYEPVLKKMEVLAEAVDHIKTCEKTMQEVGKMHADKKDTAEYEAFRKVSRVTADTLKAIKAILFQPEDVQGIFRSPDVVTSKLGGLYQMMYEIEPLNATQKLVLKQSEEIIRQTVERINRFLGNEWKAYREAAEKAGLTPFKDLKPVEL